MPHLHRLRQSPPPFLPALLLGLALLACSYSIPPANGMPFATDPTTPAPVSQRRLTHETLVKAAAVAAKPAVVAWPPPGPYVQFEGELWVLEDPVTPDALSYRLTSGTTSLHLQLQAPVTDLTSGMRLLVNGTLDPSNRLLYVVTLLVTQAASSKDYVDKDGTFRMTSITFILNICGNTNPTDMQSFRRWWLNDYGGSSVSPLGTTLQDYFHTCSYGKLRFNSSDNVVVGPLDLPCSGTGSSGPWTAGACDTAAIWGWVQEAENWATAHGYDLKKYSRRILMLPYTPTCYWAGLGSVGCNGRCYVFINGQQSMTPTVIHEIGHTLRLQHASTFSAGGEYGDCSSPMGSCDGLRCFNAPQNWQLGWAQPLALLNASTLPPGTPVSFVLPALATSSTQFIQIQPTWGGSKTFNSTFISFRSRVGADSGLLAAYSGTVSVHLLSNFNQHPYLQSSLLPGRSYTGDQQLPNTLIRFMAQTKGAASASVAVCRFISSPSECSWDQLPAVSVPPPLLLSPSPPPPPPPPTSPPPRPLPPARVASPAKQLLPPPPLGSPPPTSPPPPRPPPPRSTPASNPGASPCTSVTATCGDGFCDAWAGETCHTCPKDCMTYKKSPRPYCCGSSTTRCDDSRCNRRTTGISCRWECPTGGRDTQPSWWDYDNP